MWNLGKFLLPPPGKKASKLRADKSMAKKKQTVTDFMNRKMVFNRKNRT